MRLQESGEMYLETILQLSRKQSRVRSIDVVDSMGFSKPSVSRAVGLLRQGGYINVLEDGSLILTDEGKAVAERTFERHKVLTAFFIALGVDEKTAASDACKIEHDVSDATFEAIKRHCEKM